MDGSLIRSALVILFIFVSSTSNVVGQSGCFEYQVKWTRAAALIECDLGGDSHFWWKGKDCHDPSDFERFGIGNNGCMDNYPCNVEYTEFNRENSTFICCTENGLTDMRDARMMDCYQIAVCPTGVKMTVPPVVQTGKTATAYIEVVTKPIPPRDLDLINIQVVAGDQATSLNHTQSLVTLPEGTDNALKVFYNFEFEVPLEMVSDSSTTLTFVQRVTNLPTDSICLSPSVPSVSRVPVLAVDPGPMVTTESTTPTTNPTVATSESNTEGLSAPDCLQPGITIGVSLATFLVGLICGLIPLIFCLVRQKGGKDMSQRRLPDIPNPQMQFQFRAPPNSIPELHHAASYSSSNDTQNTTPTPTDNQRLLAGQTPNNFPPVDHHPLNPQPYATTDEMKVLRLESMGQAYPPPVKNPLDFMYNTNFPGTTPTVHTIISTEFAGQHLQAPSPEQDSILRDSHYAREGDGMELGNPVEVAVV